MMMKKYDIISIHEIFSFQLLYSTPTLNYVGSGITIEASFTTPTAHVQQTHISNNSIWCAHLFDFSQNNSNEIVSQDSFPSFAEA